MTIGHRAVPLAAALALAAAPAPARARAYTLGGQLRLHAQPGGRVLRTLDANTTVRVLSRRGAWVEVATQPGLTGYLPAARVSDVWIKAHKQERKLLLMQGLKVLKTYRVALGGNPLVDKQLGGDSATPEGRYFISELDPRPGAAKYGARSLRLSYPGIKDARNGLAAGKISYSVYRQIVAAIRAGRAPNQRTRLGSSIRIHGGGARSDWTAGCLALEDGDVVELYARVRPGTRVEIYRSAAQDAELNAPGYLARRILAGAKRQLVRPARYTRKAMGGVAIAFPMGDLPPEHAVCTDIVVRALRHAAIDLQALIHEDAATHPSRYRRTIRGLNKRLDHRRARNLQVFFEHHALVLPAADGSTARTAYAFGDVVTMDTGIRNGTPFDHIGIVDDTKDGDGFPNVINIWTVGLKTSSMALLGKSYPTMVGHFRLMHPFDY